MKFRDFTSAYHWQIENFNPVVVDITASSVTRGARGYCPLIRKSTKMHKKIPLFSTSETVLCSGIG